MSKSGQVGFLAKENAMFAVSAIVALTTGAFVCALADDGATKPYFSSAVVGWTTSIGAT